MCRFVTQRVIVHRSSRRSSKRPRTKFVEFAVDQRGYPLSRNLSNSLCNAQIRSISSTCNIARNREEKNSRPLKEIISSIGINSNDVRASFFFLVSSSSNRRNVSSTRIVIRRPGRNDSANGTTLAVVSSRRATRRLMKRKRGGKKKIITPFANPFR